ncbi:hypothetical protein B3C1_02145 [Gallaecimonas xiamenensis 3-C-1]|uniref:Phage tail collar domain-containing protein n=2 Tax=Gallaecimonas TaxID=745410 RepID=K2K3Q0_9GAMM|nr:hypothetical protein B3C1_02145 [Gallaecimonas xiamenensis 3-C-1]
MFSGNFAPRGWAYCDGQLLAISQYDALFSLLQTTYGGDGRTTFALPDLRGRLPLHYGPSSTGHIYRLGQRSGSETVTLTTAEMPSHNHPARASNNTGDEPSPQDAYWAALSGAEAGYSTASPSTAMSVQAIGLTGGSQPHPNMMPGLTLGFIISLYGIYPSRT